MDQERYEDLIWKVLSGKATEEERKRLNLSLPVKSLMKRQWNEGEDTQARAEMEERIWRRIVERCGFEKESPHHSHGLRLKHQCPNKRKNNAYINYQSKKTRNKKSKSN